MEEYEYEEMEEVSIGRLSRPNPANVQESKTPTTHQSQIWRPGRTFALVVD